MSSLYSPKNIYIIGYTSPSDFAWSKEQVGALNILLEESLLFKEENNIKFMGIMKEIS